MDGAVARSRCFRPLLTPPRVPNHHMMGIKQVLAGIEKLDAQRSGVESVRGGAHGGGLHRWVGRCRSVDVGCVCGYGVW